jgi:hypothetical protein
MTDSNVVALEPGVASDFGRIARTMHSNGSLEIDPATPFFPIQGEWTPTQGDAVNKIGRATGWTAGTISETCVVHEYGIEGSGSYRINCADRATYSRDLGDSGGPVFGRLGPSAYLMGIHFAGSGSYGMFTRLSRIRAEHDAYLPSRPGINVEPCDDDPVDGGFHEPC